MKNFRIHIARLATFLAALQILNLGFFVQDFQQLTSSSLSISDHNVINSIVEYVSEVVLQKVNAIPENNNNAGRDLQAHKHSAVKMIQQQELAFIITPVDNISKKTFPLGKKYSYHFFKEINPPPPKPKYY